jgi:DNA-binding phage protein
MQITIEERYKRLQKARKLVKRGKSISSVAKEVGLSPVFLYKHIGKPKNKYSEIDVEAIREMRKTHTLAQVAKHFGVSSSWVFCRTLEVGRKYTGRAVSRHPLYPFWYTIKVACTQPDNAMFPRYGGRGVVFHEDWLGFENFLKDAKSFGRKSRGKYLAMIDPSKGFVPGNLEWTSLRERNHRYEKYFGKKYEFRGQQLTLLEISEKYNIPYDRVYRYRMCLVALK